MKAIFKRRLLALATFLDKLPRKRFNYGRWVGSDWQGDPKLSCGTTACALGWATTMPMFRRLGLKLEGDGMPWLNREHPRSLFGLSNGEFSFLFVPSTRLFGGGLLASPSPGSNATPKQVSQHIRRFILLKEKLEKEQ